MSENINPYLKTIRVCAYLMMVLAVCGTIIYAVHQCGFPALLLIIGAVFMGFCVYQALKD